MDIVIELGRQERPGNPKSYTCKYTYVLRLYTDNHYWTQSFMI